VRERAGLARLSGERVRDELLRLLAAPRGPEIAALMQDYGLMPAVLGAAPRSTLLARLAAIEEACGLAPDAVRRLAALVVEVEEDALRLRERLRLSNEQTEKLLGAATRRPKVDTSAAEVETRVALYRLGPEAYRERVLVAWARSGEAPQSEAWRRRLALPERWQAPTFPLGGGDVLAQGVPPGPRIGELLRTLEDWWIAGDFGADAAVLRAKLRDLLAAA
jgi:poly(A) polymerase